MKKFCLGCLVFVLSHSAAVFAAEERTELFCYDSLRYEAAGYVDIRNDAKAEDEEVMRQFKSEYEKATGKSGSVSYCVSKEDSESRLETMQKYNPAVTIHHFKFVPVKAYVTCGGYQSRLEKNYVVSKEFSTRTAAFAFYENHRDDFVSLAKEKYDAKGGCSIINKKQYKDWVSLQSASPERYVAIDWSPLSSSIKKSARTSVSPSQKHGAKAAGLVIDSSDAIKNKARQEKQRVESARLSNALAAEKSDKAKRAANVKADEAARVKEDLDKAANKKCRSCQ